MDRRSPCNRPLGDIFRRRFIFPLFSLRHLLRHDHHAARNAINFDETVPIFFAKPAPHRVNQTNLVHRSRRFPDDKIPQRQILSAQAIRLAQKLQRRRSRTRIRIPKPVALQAIATNALLMQRFQVINLAVPIPMFLQMRISPEIRRVQMQQRFPQIVDIIIRVRE